MGVVERRAHLAHDAQPFAGVEAAAEHRSPQVAAVGVFHDEEPADTVLELGLAENARDARVAQPRHLPGAPEKALAAGAIAAYCWCRTFSATSRRVDVSQAFQTRAKPPLPIASISL